MSPSELEYLSAILGSQGAQALEKAAQRSPQLVPALLPRAVLSWISLMAPLGFSGEIPGSSGTHLSFDAPLTKAEGEGAAQQYAGTVKVKDNTYKFKNASLYQLAAAVLLSLNANVSTADLEDKELAKLGKSIDLLVKANFYGPLAKADLPGAVAGPKAPLAPSGPTAPSAPKVGAGTPKAPSLPKPSNPGKIKLPSLKLKLPGLKVGKSEMGNQCSICSKTHFKGNSFVGCNCLKDLAKSVTSETKPDGVILSFGNGWTQETFELLQGILNGS